MQTLRYGIGQIVARVAGIDFGHRVDAGSTLDQQLHRVGVRLLGGPHQSRGSAQLVLGVHVGVIIQKQFEGVQIARARYQHQRSFAFRAELIGIGAGLQQLPDHRRASMQGRQIQRRGAFTIPELDVRPSRDQHIRHFQIVAIHGPLDRCGAVGLRRIDVGFLFHQSLARLPRRHSWQHRRPGYWSLRSPRYKFQ